MLKNLKRENPWASLRMSRKEYETRRQGKNSDVEQQGVDEYIMYFFDAAIDALHREVDAETFVKAIFRNFG